MVFLLYLMSAKLQSSQYHKLMHRDFTVLLFIFIQGFVEDQFGLGLIARAVEEGIAVIKPMGIMIFNMGGRPGQAVCKRLFERRVVRIDKLWQTKILQASTNLVAKKLLYQNCTPYEHYCCRLVTQIYRLWLRLKKTVHIVLSFSWGWSEISLYVLEQHGLWQGWWQDFSCHYVLHNKSLLLFLDINTTVYA